MYYSKCHRKTRVPSRVTTHLFSDCDPPPNIRNMDDVNYVSLIAGATATYTCNPDYILIGPASIECLDNGEWTPLPNCLPGKCLSKYHCINTVEEDLANVKRECFFF